MSKKKNLRRYDNVPIESSEIGDFFLSAGDYPGVEKTMNQLSPIWFSVFSKFGTNIFELMERKQYDNIAKAYEKYSLTGLSDGACGGRRLNNLFRKYYYNQRNKQRLQKLSTHLGFNRLRSVENNALKEEEIIDSLFKHFDIPETILSGQPWGWSYGKKFVHAELLDHLYFADIALRVLQTEKLSKLMYIGDGSGILSALISRNYNRIEKVDYIDLAHFLIKQFLSNPLDRSKTHFHYAETVQSKDLFESQILINQDSFPEIPEESLKNYYSVIGKGKLSHILSYNQEDTKNGHSDFRTLILNHGMVSSFRFESQLRPNYFIELFKRKM